jgi:hypothetical protein
MRILFLDDLRNPVDIFKYDTENHSFCVVRTVAEAIEAIQKEKFDKWSLDHDLGEELTGYDFVKSVAYGYPELWCHNINVHSANPVGRENIEKFCQNFSNFLYNSYRGTV